MIETPYLTHDILVYGRGSQALPDGSRALSIMARRRVLAVAHYIFDNSALFDREVRVQFSAGWAAGEGQECPEAQFREAVLMDQYAEQIDLKSMPGVTFDVQPNSYSTATDGIMSAQSNFFGRRPVRYTQQNPLGVVAQIGPKQDVSKTNLDGHMARCLDATQRAYRLKRQNLLPIIADGIDVPDSGMPEGAVTLITRIVNIGARSDRDLMWRDKKMIDASVGIQNFRNRKK